MSFSPAGTTTITATSVLDQTKKGTATVKVTDSSTLTYMIGWGNASGATGTYTNFNTPSSGTVNNILSFSTAKNGGTSDPAIASGDYLRLYYNSNGNGCSITLTPANGIAFKKVVITTNTTTKVEYKADGGTATSVERKSNAYTIDGLNVKQSLFVQNTNTTNVKLDISTIEITYQEITLSSISINTAPKTTYDAGDYFDPTGLVIGRTFSDSSTDTYSYSGHTSEFSFSIPLNQRLEVSDILITITFGEKSVDLDLTVNKVKGLTSISISGYTTEFTEGDTFSFGGTVTAYFDDSTSDVVTSSATFSGYDMLTPGNQTVTVSYDFKGTVASKTYGITIAAGTLSSLEISGQTTVYNKGATFSFDGTCKAVFANGYKKVVTPTVATAPNMNVGGQKTITLNYTYNGKTVETSYTITVNSYRTVMEATKLSKTYDCSSGSITAGSGISDASYQQTGYTASSTGNGGIQCASGGTAFSLTISTTSSVIVQLDVYAKQYSSSEKTATIAGSQTTFTDSIECYTFDFASSLNTKSVTISTSKGKRFYLNKVIIYALGPEEDIGQTEDCVGLETFINNNMHMDYTDNKGWCKDSEHHYYATARDAFNLLNDHQRSLFTTNSAYSSEWDRLRTWAEFNNESLNSQNKLGAIEKVNEASVSNNETIVLVVIVSMISLSIIGGYFYFKNKRRVSE